MRRKYFSTGYKNEVFNNCTDEAYTACDETNGKCTYCTAGHENSSGKCTTCTEGTYTLGGP